MYVILFNTFYYFLMTSRVIKWIFNLLFSIITIHFTFHEFPFVVLWVTHYLWFPPSEGHSSWHILHHKTHLFHESLCKCIVINECTETQLRALQFTACYFSSCHKPGMGDTAQPPSQCTHLIYMRRSFEQYTAYKQYSSRCWCTQL